MEKAVFFKSAKTETMHVLPNRDIFPVEKTEGR